MFSESKSIEELSRNFIMVNCLDEEEPVHAVFKPVSVVPCTSRESSVVDSWNVASGLAPFASAMSSKCM